MKPNITRVVLAIYIIALIAGPAGCNMKQTAQGEKMVAPRTIEEVLQANTPQLMAIEGVVGTAQGEHQGKPCIMIFVAEKTPELMKKLPSGLEGYPVVIQQSGEFEAL